MAAINSHRKRQVYHQHLSRRGHSLIGNAPAAAATIMPDKAVSGNDWYAHRREFAELGNILQRKYFGTTVQRKTLTNPGTGNYVTVDTIQTHPGGMVNLNAAHNPMRYYYLTNNSSVPMMYSVELSAASGLLAYSRKNNGLMLNGHNSYKHIRNQTAGNGYQHVASLGDYFGGNIKSRATLLKWVGGMWRAK